jgi:hypothetical protein
MFKDQVPSISLLLSHMGVAFIERRLSLLILFIIFWLYYAIPVTPPVQWIFHNSYFNLKRETSNLPIRKKLVGTIDYCITLVNQLNYVPQLELFEYFFQTKAIIICSIARVKRRGILSNFDHLSLTPGYD